MEILQKYFERGTYSILFHNSPVPGVKYSFECSRQIRWSMQIVYYAPVRRLPDDKPSGTSAAPVNLRDHDNDAKSSPIDQCHLNQGHAVCPVYQLQAQRPQDNDEKSHKPNVSRSPVVVSVSRKPNGHQSGHTKTKREFIKACALIRNTHSRY